MADPLSAAQIVALAETVERSGEAFYQAVLDEVQRADVRALVTQLRDDERTHRQTFAALAAAVEETPVVVDPERLAFLTALAGYQVFPDPEAARAFVLAIDNEATLLRHAINFEKDTILFLHELRVLVGAAHHALVDRLLEEERGHVRGLDRLLASMGGRPAQ